MRQYFRTLRGGCPSAKTAIDDHIGFWVAFAASIVLFIWVPQIRNIWAQAWPGGTLFVPFLLFLLFLLSFYVLSLFLLMRPYPARVAHTRIESLTSRLNSVFSDRPLPLQKTYAGLTILLRLPIRFLEWAFMLLIRLLFKCEDRDDTLPAGVAAWWGRLEPQQLMPRCVPRTRSTWWGWSLLVFGGVTFLLLSFRADRILWYPLAGAFCLNAALMLTLIGVWILLAIRGARAPTPTATAASASAEGEEASRELHILSVYAGRVLSWGLLALFLGEALWLAATFQPLGGLFSYRLYTIWAAVQILWSVVIIALFIDRCHWEAKFPVRPVVLPLVAGVVLVLAGPDRVSRHECVRPVPDTVGADTASPDAEPAWLDRFLLRIRSVRAARAENEAKPMVLIAASGGGSRAAIFTALSLETLSRTPLDAQQPILVEDDMPRSATTLEDNIVLISSVSGGSLATGYFVHRCGLEERLPSVEGLRHTSKRELIERCRGQLRERLAEFEADEAGLPALDIEGQREKPESLARTIEVLDGKRQDLRQSKQSLFRKLAQATTDSERENIERSLRETLDDLERLDHYLTLVSATIHMEKASGEGDRPEHGWKDFFNTTEFTRFSWALKSGYFDAMCTDFMAPLSRAVLTPGMDRGDSLARFWTERFGWRRSSNLYGYQVRKEEFVGYRPDLPLVVFNATDVAAGSRLAIGFPPLRGSLWRDEIWETSTYENAASWKHPVSLQEYHPGFAMTLARAVRLSSNFPWGFSVLQIDPNEKAETAGDGQEIFPIHVLDGGVVDNTGLDTVYYLVRSLDYLAARPLRPGATAGGNLEADKAREALRLLRESGVLILEIDSGAKPSGQRPSFLFAASSEPIQALNNASYTNAERAKRFYVEETKRMIRESFVYDVEATAEPDATALARIKVNVPDVALHVKFQCNHYRPGEQTSGSDIMTAWTLGPADKAEVVSRFCLELGLWDASRLEMFRELQKMVERHRAFKDGIEKVAALQQSVVQLAENQDRLSRARQELLDAFRVSKRVESDDILQLADQYRAHVKSIEELVGGMKRDANRGEDSGLLAVWEEARVQANAQIQLFEKLADAEQKARLAAALSDTEKHADDGLRRVTSQLKNRVPEQLQATLSDEATRRPTLNVQQMLDHRAMKTEQYFGGSAKSADRR